MALLIPAGRAERHDRRDGVVCQTRRRLRPGDDGYGEAAAPPTPQSRSPSPRETREAGITHERRQPAPQSQPALDDARVLRVGLPPQLVVNVHCALRRLLAVEGQIQHEGSDVVVVQHQLLALRHGRVDEVIHARVQPQQRLTVSSSSLSHMDGFASLLGVARPEEGGHGVIHSSQHHVVDGEFIVAATHHFVDGGADQLRLHEAILRHVSHLLAAQRIHAVLRAAQQPPEAA